MPDIQKSMAKVIGETKIVAVRMDDDTVHLLTAHNITGRTMGRWRWRKENGEWKRFVGKGEVPEVAYNAAKEMMQ